MPCAVNGLVPPDVMIRIADLRVLYGSFAAVDGLDLDIHSAEVVHRILRERVKLGATVVMTTHDMDEVEKICDRVGIVNRGKLIALDSPLALRQEHTERKVDVIRKDGERLVFDMDDERSLADFASFVSSGQAASVRTREFDFHAAFLKLTGQSFE